MNNNVQIRELLSDLVSEVELFYNCVGLYRTIWKLINNENKLQYLLLHKNNNNIPIHILSPLIKLEYVFNQKFLKANKYNNSTFNTFAHKLLSLDIQQAQWTRNNIVSDLSKKVSNSDLQLVLNHIKAHINYSKILDILMNNNNKKMNRKIKVKNTYMAQTHNLLPGSTIISNNLVMPNHNNFNHKHYKALEVYNNYHNNNLTINLSKTNIPPNIVNFLSLGPNFSLPSYKPNNKNVINFLAEIESIITSVDTSENHKNSVRNTINNQVSTFLNIKHSNTLLNPVETRIIKDLKEFDKWKIVNKDKLIITTTDKTKQTVILEHDMYVLKMNELLSNKSEYKTIRTNPIEELN